MGTTKNSKKHVVFFSENHYKIAKNLPILMKLTVPNRQDFVIFKTHRFFEFGQILTGEGSDLQIFGRLKVQVCFLIKWTLVRKTTICQFKNGKADISQQFFAKNLFLNVKALGIRFSPVFLKVPYFLELEILYELGRGAYSHIPNPKEGQKFPPLASSRRESMKVVYGCPQLWSCKGSSINHAVKILGFF